MRGEKAQMSSVKPFLNQLDEEFARLHARLRALLNIIPAQDLYRQPREGSDHRARHFPILSCGEHLLRAAAVVEQTFGGLTTNLWDDPFEWTLPETLSTPERIATYLIEVEATRQRGFQLFNADMDLQKEIVVPSGEVKKLGALMLETLVRAAHHEGKAFATLRLFVSVQLPPV